jgi:uncharacterized membrane protein
MIESIRKNGLLLALLWCTALCGGLIAIRMAITDQHYYRWLIVPNVLLAWIPYGLSAWISRIYERNGRWSIGIAAIGLAWLFFFPNCFYIITDLVHIGYFSKPSRPALLYYDVSVNVLAAMLGWLLGVLSLYRLHELIRNRSGAIGAHVFALMVLMLSSIGVYLGRFLRWNSWDLVNQPMKIVKDTIEALGNLDSLQFIIVFALVTGSLYFVMYNWKRST